MWKLCGRGWVFRLRTLVNITCNLSKHEWNILNLMLPSSLNPFLFIFKRETWLIFASAIAQHNGEGQLHTNIINNLQFE